MGFTHKQPNHKRLFLENQVNRALENRGQFDSTIPIGSMDGIFTYIWPNLGEYTIHGSYGISMTCHREFAESTSNQYLTSDDMKEKQMSG